MTDNEYNRWMKMLALFSHEIDAHKDTFETYREATDEALALVEDIQNEICGYEHEVAVKVDSRLSEFLAKFRTITERSGRIQDLQSMNRERLQRAYWDDSIKYVAIQEDETG